MFPIVESGHPDIAPPEAPTAKSAVGFFLLLMVLYAGLGGTAQAWDPLAGLVWTELFVFLLAPVVVAAGSNLRPAPFLLLERRPSSTQVLVGAAAGLALFLAAGGIMSLTTLLVPRAWVEAFDVTHLFEGSDRRKIGMAVVASVLAPLAEEVAFRGYVLSALRTRLPPGPAIAGSALLFACMHLDPVRFPAVLFLGLFLGWLAWRSGSVWPAVAAHAVNNALGSAVAAGADGGAAAAGQATVAASLAIIVLGGAALAPVGLAWLRATPSPPGLGELLVRRDPSDPSVRFRLPLVPPGWASLAALGLLLYVALAIRHAMAR